MTESASPAFPPASGDSPLVIEFWTDLGCPWCYVGEHRLDKAVEVTASASRVEVVLRSFELHPDTPRTPVPVVEVFAATHGGTTEHARKMEGQMAARAHAEGLPYTVDRPVANSFDVHRVLHPARAHRAGTQMYSALQRGYFAGDFSPYDHPRPGGRGRRCAGRRDARRAVRRRVRARCP